MKGWRLPVIAVFLICAAAVSAGCEKEREVGVKAHKKIALVELYQETNMFSEIPTTERNFKAGSLLYGKDIIPFAKKEKRECGGFIAAVEKLGGGSIEIVPVLKASSESGGPVERALYERFKKEIVETLKASEKLDGVYIRFHGAMGVEGMSDPEGDILKAIRGVLGNSIPIGVTNDLHANITKERARLATFIVGRKTNPHRDFFDVGYKAGELLIRTIRGEIHPVMAFRKMRLLKGGGMCIDFLSPMRQIFSRMKKMEKQDRVLSVSNFQVNPFLDDPEMGWSTIAVTDGDLPLAEKLADEIADLNWAVRDVKPPEGHTPSEAIKIARDARFMRRFGTAVFCDASDAVGAGAPGENVWILKSLLAEGADMVSYVPLRDAEAASFAYGKNLHDKVTVTVGRKLDKIYNTSLSFTGELIYKSEGRLGKTVILRDRGIHLIITELPDSTPRTSYFTDLGLSLWKADIVVVKNLFPFRFFYLLYNRKTVNVITPGISNLDVFSLKYTKIPRPIYPLDKIDSWQCGKNGKRHNEL
jgi:microcystin degradation protein MlrC